MIRRTLRRAAARRAAELALLAASTPTLMAMTITGYDTTLHNRFASGYPTAPVANNSSTFVGQGYDWSGVAWANSLTTKSFAFLSPQHYLGVNHYGGDSSLRVVVNGTVASYNQAAFERTGYGVVFSGQTLGDLSLGTLTAPIAPAVQPARYAVLDLNSGSTLNDGAYLNQPLLMYGRGASTTVSTRVGGGATLNGTSIAGASQYYWTARSAVQLENGDSGSPTFIGWTSPNGGRELTVIGNHAGISTSYNFDNFLGSYQVMNALNTLMNDDGFALRVVGNPSATWKGGGKGKTGQQDDLFLSANWSPAATPSDKFALFNGAATSYRTVEVNPAGKFRGLYFKNTTATGDGFTFTGAATLTLGRGGLVNYDNDRQTLVAPVTLSDSQLWNPGTGGVSVGSLNTNGKLLEIMGGTTTLNGPVSGAGGLALSGGRLELNGANSYSGRTWLHAGELLLGGSTLPTGVVQLDPGAHLSGSGKTGTLTGAGVINPGCGAGILTATAVDPAAGLDFNFEFTSTGAPAYDNPTASRNDLLRLTAATPFAAPLTAANEISIYLNRETLVAGDAFQGGFFTDNFADLGAVVENATFRVYLADPAGDTTYNGVTYKLYDGPCGFSLGTGQVGGPVAGWILQITTLAPTP